MHEQREQRHQRLGALVEHAFADGGTILIPAFSIGRTQELLYELETLVHERAASGARASGEWQWQDLAVVLDSPLAADFTAGYSRLRRFWDEEASARLDAGRHPLDFAQLLTVDSHADQQNLVDFIAAMDPPPEEVVLVHGEERAKRALQQVPQASFAGVEVRIGV